MSHGTNIIIPPVTMPYDFAAVMQIAGTNLSDNNTSAVINKWAKFKPIPYATIGILPDTTRKSRNFGIINIPTWSNINKMANFVLGLVPSQDMPANAPDIGIQPIYWGYRTPGGGSSEPYRLTDWSDDDGEYGYYHGAEQPVGGSLYTEYTIESSGHLRIVFKNGAQDVRTIKLDELTYPTAGYDVGNMYFGLMMVKQGTSTVYAATGPRISDLPSLGAYVDINGLGPSYNGLWDIFPMASADQITFTSSLGQLTNGKFIAFTTDVETVGIGATVVRMDVVPQTMYAYRDTDSSTRILYTGLTIENINSGQGSARVLFEVFNVNNTLLGSNTVTVSNVNVGARASVVGDVDLGTLTNLRNAFSVRATVTPTYVTNYATSSDACNVTNGRPR